MFNFLLLLSPLRRVFAIYLTQATMLMLLCGVAVARESSGQDILNKYITLEVENTEFGKVLSLIEGQTEVRFLYSPNVVKVDRKVSVKANNKRLELVLAELLQPLSITFKVSDNRILLKSDRKGINSNPARIERQPVRTTESTVTGTVTDEAGAALPGVSILIKNTLRGTTTDQNGKYSLTLQNQDATLVFSYVGYEPRELSLPENQTQIDVVLKASANSLSEVVVTAVGLERSRKSIGYSIQEVKGSDLVSARETNLVSALSGKVAGVQVINSGGSPGASAIIRIRGNSSLFSNNSPLFVIDGVPVDNSNDLTFVSNANSGVTQSNRAIDFNPDDIDKMSVLKGPSATALYGIRASNGAIIISTKRGKMNESGKLNITYSTALTVDEVNRRVQPTQQNLPRESTENIANQV